jgi:ethanolamine ammonia-lyase small subunit
MSGTSDFALAPALAARLRSLTPARIALGRTGVSQHTRDQLAFQRCHALARDAVHAQLQPATLAAAIAAITGNEALRLHSAAQDRACYLQRPDLGRRLDEAGRNELARFAGSRFDLAIVVADGLSALAVERHAHPLLEAFLPQLKGWKLAPVCVVEQGRVAIGDEIGELLAAELAVVLIGERPGLSSPDSLGAYITWQPRPGRTDAERNCVSNIRTEGLGYDQAAGQLVRYLIEARRRRITGVELKLASPQSQERLKPA